MPTGEVAKAVGFSGAYFSVLKDLPLFREELERVRAEVKELFVDKTSSTGNDVHAYLEKEGLASAHKVVSLRDNAENQRTQLAAAQDILDRLGHRGKETISVESKVLAAPGLAEMLAVAAKELKEKKNDATSK